MAEVTAASMLFSVDHDIGSVIKAYLVPDSAGATPRVRVRSGGKDLAVVEATEVLPVIVEHGRHTTGRCGFLITDGTVANLASYEDLELVDAVSELRVYRRRAPGNILSKVFRLETHLMRLRKLDNRLADVFQYWYSGIDRYGGETTSQVFQIFNLESAFISGRVFLNTVELELSHGYRLTAMFRNPYDELAERLIVLKNIGTQAADLLGARDALTYEPVIEALAEVETFDRASCKRFLKRADKIVLTALSNPLVRQLTSKNGDDRPRPGCMSAALQALAGFELLGLRSDAASYAHSLEEMFELPVSSVPVIAEPTSVLELGAILREIKDAEQLLDYDLELYDHAAGALGTV